VPQELFDIEHFLRSADWHTLARLRGSAHNTIIGFLSSRWLGYSPNHFVLDGAPSTHIGSKTQKRRYADLLFCRDKSPLIVVEVESTEKKYPEKKEALCTYLDDTENFSGLQFGMLVLLNYTDRAKDRYQHHWGKLKTVVRQSTHNIVLVSFQKRSEPLPFSAKTHARLLKDMGYYSWVHQSIDFWVHFHDHEVREGNLWSPSATGDAPSQGI
jgi:hypothetical protein